MAISFRLCFLREEASLFSWRAELNPGPKAKTYSDSWRAKLNPGPVKIAFPFGGAVFYVHPARRDGNFAVFLKG